MQRVQDTLLQVLSDTIWHKPSEYSFTESEWEDILTLAEAHGVSFLVLQEASSISRQVSPEKWSGWRRKLLSTVVNNASLMAVQTQIVGLLAQQGIPCAILKGTSLAACYPDPLARALGDIDLLVAPEYVDQAAGILASQGFRAPKESYDHPYHIDFYRNNTVLELHFAASTFPDSETGAHARRVMDSCWQGIRTKRVEEHTFPCLSDYHQALSLMLHMERHMTNGCIGLRQLCDWAVFVKDVPAHSFEAEILPMLERCGLAEFARVLTKACVQYLGLDPDWVCWCRMVRDRHTEAMMREILRTGSIHNKNNNDDLSSLFVESSGSEPVIRVFVRKINKIARKRFPVTKKVPLLLPVFWVYIPVRYWIRSLAGVRRRKSILQTISMTKQRKQLYRELKLFHSDEKRGKGNA